MIAREEIVAAAKAFFEARPTAAFVPGETYIPPSGKVMDGQDCANIVDAALDMWLTAGRYADAFEDRLAKVFGRKLSKLTVAGSVAPLEVAAGADIVCLACALTPANRHIVNAGNRPMCPPDPHPSG